MNKELLIALIKEGKSTYIIGKEIGKSSSTVIYWIKSLGLSNLYKENSKNSTNKDYVKSHWKKEVLEQIIPNCITYTKVLEDLHLVPRGHNFRTLQKYIKKYDIDISHFDPDKNKKHPNKFRKELSELLLENTQVKSHDLKERLYKEGYKERICELCGQGEEWNGRKMSLILDHINGEHSDNRLENLRVVCPNCNATLDTHCGKHKTRRKVYYCECGKEKEKTANSCRDCCSKIKKNKTDSKIDIEVLRKEVIEIPLSVLCKKYDLSDNGLKKVCKRMGIETQKRGYWKKLNSQIG